MRPARGTRVDVANVRSAATGAADDRREPDLACAVELELELLAIPGPSCEARFVAEDAVRSIGRTPFRVVANGGLDANWTSRNGIPTATLGCVQASPHTVTEALDLAGFRDAFRIALRLAIDCRSGTWPPGRSGSGRTPTGDEVKKGLGYVAGNHWSPGVAVTPWRVK